eukprot:EG_transcript_32139
MWPLSRWPSQHRPWRLVGTVLLVLLVWSIAAVAGHLAHLWATVPGVEGLALPEALQSPAANPLAFVALQLLLLLGLPAGGCLACCSTCCSLPVVAATVAATLALLVVLPY